MKQTVNGKSSDGVNIFKVLISDHDKHRALLKKIEAAVKGGDITSRQRLFEDFALEAKAHAAAEEQALYGMMMSRPDLTDKARHSVSEHKEIEDLINEMAELDAASEGWVKKFKALNHEYIHHIDEEEEEIFPAAEEELSAKEEAQMGKVFKDRKPQEKDAATVGEADDDD